MDRGFINTLLLIGAFYLLGRLIKFLKMLYFQRKYYSINPIIINLNNKNRNILYTGVLFAFSISAMLFLFLKTQSLKLPLGYYVGATVLFFIALSLFIGCLHAFNFYLYNGEYDINEAIIKTYHKKLKTLLQKSIRKISKKGRYVDVAVHKLQRLIKNNSQIYISSPRRSNLGKPSFKSVKNVYHVNFRPYKKISGVLTNHFVNADIIIDVYGEKIVWLIVDMSDLSIGASKKFSRIFKKDEVVNFHDFASGHNKYLLNKVMLVFLYSIKDDLQFAIDRIEKRYDSKAEEKVPLSLFIWDTLYKNMKFNQNYFKPGDLFSRSLIFIQSFIAIILLYFVGRLLLQK